MTPEAAIGMYRRLIASGEDVLLRRYTGTGATRAKFEVRVRAKVAGYEPQDLVGSVQQGDRKVIVLAEDVDAAQFPVPITNSDKIVVRGKELTIQSVDDSTRRIAGVLVAYELPVRG